MSLISDYWPYPLLAGCIIVAVTRYGRYRRVEQTGEVVEATITQLTTPENQGYELSHTGYVDMTVHLSVPLRDGSEVQTSIVEQFSHSHFRRVGDRLTVVVDPRNPKIVYLPDKAARARSGMSDS